MRSQEPSSTLLTLCRPSRADNLPFTPATAVPYRTFGTRRDAHRATLRIAQQQPNTTINNADHGRKERDGAAKIGSLWRETRQSTVAPRTSTTDPIQHGRGTETRLPKRRSLLPLERDQAIAQRGRLPQCGFPESLVISTALDSFFPVTVTCSEHCVPAGLRPRHLWECGW